MHDFYGMLIYSENIIVIPASLTLLKSIDLKQQKKQQQQQKQCFEQVGFRGTCSRHN